MIPGRDVITSFFHRDSTFGLSIAIFRFVSRIHCRCCLTHVRSSDNDDRADRSSRRTYSKRSPSNSWTLRENRLHVLRTRPTVRDDVSNNVTVRYKIKYAWRKETFWKYPHPNLSGTSVSRARNLSVYENMRDWLYHIVNDHNPQSLFIFTF